MYCLLIYLWIQVRQTTDPHCSCNGWSSNSQQTGHCICVDWRPGAVEVKCEGFSCFSVKKLGGASFCASMRSVCVYHPMMVYLSFSLLLGVCLLFALSWCSHTPYNPPKHAHTIQQVPQHGDRLSLQLLLCWTTIPQHSNACKTFGDGHWLCPWRH